MESLYWTVSKSMECPFIIIINLICMSSYIHRTGRHNDWRSLYIYMANLTLAFEANTSFSLFFFIYFFSLCPYPNTYFFSRSCFICQWKLLKPSVGSLLLAYQLFHLRGHELYCLDVQAYSTPLSMFILNIHFPHYVRKLQRWVAWVKPWSSMSYSYCVLFLHGVWF